MFCILFAIFHLTRNLLAFFLSTLAGAINFLALIFEQKGGDYDQMAFVVKRFSTRARDESPICCCCPTKFALQDRRLVYERPPRAALEGVKKVKVLSLPRLRRALERRERE